MRTGEWIMYKVLLTITESKCRGGYVNKEINLLWMIFVHRYVMNYGIQFILLCMR